MYYAICPKQDGKEWIILRGWEGCQVGDGEVIERGLTYKQTNEKLKKLNSETNLKTSQQRGLFNIGGFYGYC
jgi:hypothetical protein